MPPSANNQRMAAADIRDPPSARRRIRPLTVLSLFAAVVAALRVAGVGVGRLISQRAIREELARIRAAGEPVTPDDLEAFYALPPGYQDTSALWLAAAEAISKPAYEADAQPLPLVGTPGPGPAQSVPELPEIGAPWVYDLAAEKFLAKYADILATVHEAAALGGEARYPARFHEGVWMPLEPVVPLRAVAYLLALEREMNLRRGDGHAAAGSVRAVFALARGFKREPLLVAELLRVAFDGLAIAGLERILPRAELSDEDLSALDRDLAALEYHPQLHAAMLGERVFTLQSFDDPELLGSDVPNALVWRLFRPADRALFLQCMRELIAVSAAPDLASLRTAGERAQRDIAALMAAPSARWRYPMTKARLPSLDGMAGAIGRATARRELARTAIAVERFERAKGRLPDSLEELAPDFMPQPPTDPFTGGPPHWVVSGDEYRIYSVGINGIDDGGTPGTDGTDGDVIFRGRKR